MQKNLFRGLFHLHDKLSQLEMQYSIKFLFIKKCLQSLLLSTDVPYSHETFFIVKKIMVNYTFTKDTLIEAFIGIV